MSGQKDFLNILREVRGTAAPGVTPTDGIWYELTVADIDGNAGIYGDILAKYGIIADSAPTFQQAVNIIENLNIVVTWLTAGSTPTSALVNGVWQLGIPVGKDGLDGERGLTPVPVITYNETTGELEYVLDYQALDPVKEW